MAAAAGGGGGGRGGGGRGARGLSAKGAGEGRATDARSPPAGVSLAGALAPLPNPPPQASNVNRHRANDGHPLIACQHHCTKETLKSVHATKVTTELPVS